jgi:hypothetical protein
MICRKFRAHVSPFHRRYSFQGQNRRRSDEDEEDGEEGDDEGMFAQLSHILNGKTAVTVPASAVHVPPPIRDLDNPDSQDALEERVASVSADLAAAIAQVQSRIYSSDEDELEFGTKPATSRSVEAAGR